MTSGSKSPSIAEGSQTPLLDNADINDASGEPARDNECHHNIPNYEEDSAFNDLSLYEQKAALVNREIDAQGMGRYQWMIFSLCGFGYMLDLLWAQAFGLVVNSLQQEIGFPDSQLGNIFTAFSVGLTVGAIVWGVLVDIIGRRWAFNLTVLISSIFGLLLGVQSSYSGILILTVFVGFGVGGNIPIDTTITLEFLPQKNRWLLPTLSVFQPIGVVTCSGIAYAFIPFYSCGNDQKGDPLKACRLVPEDTPCCTKASNYGWRYLLFTIGGLTFLVFFARFIIFRFQESPKFLLYRGHDKKAVTVLQYIAHYNKRECSINLTDFQALEQESESGSTTSAVSAHSMSDKKHVFHTKIMLEMLRFKGLFADTTITRLTLCVWIIYAFDFWGFTIAGAFLPVVLLRKGRELSVSLIDTYRNYIYIYSFGIPGVLLGTAVYKGRRLAMLFSSALFGAFLFVFTIVDTEAKYIGISGLVYFFQSMFNAVLYGWTPEAFPAPVRGTASGVASFWGRLFSIISPLIAQHILATSLDGVFYLAGAGVFVCTLFILMIPKKYLGGQSY